MPRRAEARVRDDVRFTVDAFLFAGAFRLDIDAFLTPARRELRDDTRALFTGARYAGTEKAAPESESDRIFAILVT